MATAKKNKSTKKNYANKKTVHEQIVDQLLAYMEKGSFLGRSHGLHCLLLRMH